MTSSRRSNVLSCPQQARAENETVVVVVGRIGTDHKAVVDEVVIGLQNQAGSIRNLNQTIFINQ